MIRKEQLYCQCTHKFHEHYYGTQCQRCFCNHFVNAAGNYECLCHEDDLSIFICGYHLCEDCEEKMSK